MRLLHTRTLQFREFPGRDKPEYAILSHTWEEEEVSFRDMAHSSYSTKQGYQKIEMTCKLAAEAGIEYAWIDTCNIDKTSSAELTQAINSMFRWYQRSKICYAYLSDLTAWSSLEAALPACRWFTRGWTLQEIIAPTEVLFFDQDWNYRGSKRTLHEHLSKITRISAKVLLHEVRLASISVAQKMSWAAHRQSTMVEDTAYCLMGIFNVNMPLLYGEEEKAFRRLQEEILKTTPDLSILAWRLPNDGLVAERDRQRIVCGFLAESPDAFAGCTSIVKDSQGPQPEYSMTGLGVRVRTRIGGERIAWKNGYREVLPLGCSWLPRQTLGVRIKKVGPDWYVREDPWELLDDTAACGSQTGRPRERHFLTELPFDNCMPLMDMSLMTSHVRSRVIQMKFRPGLQHWGYYPRSTYDIEDDVFFLSENTPSTCCALVVRLDDSRLKPEKQPLAVFFAVGWSELSASALQCSLVEYGPHAKAFNELEITSNRFEWGRDEVLRQLLLREFPRSSSAVFSVEELGGFAEISFETELVSDLAVAQNRFWRVTFSYKVHSWRKKPSPRITNWKW